MLKHTNTCYGFNLQPQFSGELHVPILTLPLGWNSVLCHSGHCDRSLRGFIPLADQAPVFIYFTPLKCLLLIPLSLTCIVTETILTLKFFAKLIGSQVHTCNPNTKENRAGGLWRAAQTRGWNPVCFLVLFLALLYFGKGNGPLLVL